MGITQLSLVTILIAKSELEELITELYEFEDFHPSDQEGSYEELSFNRLKSKTLELNLEINSVIGKLEDRYHFNKDAENIERFVIKSNDWSSLLSNIVNELRVIRGKLSCKIRLSHKDLTCLIMFRETTFLMFEILRRIKIKHELKYFVTIEGYIPTKSEKKFCDQFSQWYHTIKPLRRDKDVSPIVPTRLTNPRFIKLFEDITVVQGIPKYSDIDPTPLIAFVFPFFYGIMFPDLGQGLLFILFGKVLSMQRIKIKMLTGRKYKYWGKMLMTFGVSASIVGLLSGGNFFGLELANYGIHYIMPFSNIRIFGGNGSTTINIETVTTVMIIAILIGTFHLASAYIIAIINKIREKKYAEAFTYHLATLVTYSFGILLGLSFIGSGNNITQLFSNSRQLPVFSSSLDVHIQSSTAAIISVPIIIISMLTIVFGRAISSLIHKQRDYITRINQGITDAAFIPIIFLTNTISYARLGIFFIMHSALMGLVNSAWQYGIAGLPTIILGNIAVMILEGFLVYIQDLRLHLYEWVTKFSDDGDDKVMFFRGLKSDADVVELKFSHNDEEKQLATLTQNILNYRYTIP